jgi:hypothetical protein
MQTISRLRSQWKTVLLLGSLAVIGVAAGYHESADFGFRYDDYGVVRPWTKAEVIRVLDHSWDPTGIEPNFYRPLSAWWYALRFSIFGLNAKAQHLVSLAGMTLCALLAGLFVWRETNRPYTAEVQHRQSDRDIDHRAAQIRFFENQQDISGRQRHLSFSGSCRPRRSAPPPGPNRRNSLPLRSPIPLRRNPWISCQRFSIARCFRRVVVRLRRRLRRSCRRPRRPHRRLRRRTSFFSVL